MGPRERRRVFPEVDEWTPGRSAIKEGNVVLAVTPTASQVIRELVTSRGLAAGAGLRIAPDAEPAGAFSLRVAAAPEANDQVVPIEDLGVFLEPRVADALDDKILDAGVGPEGKVSFSVVEQSTQ
jgi:hypothetical protein